MGAPRQPHKPSGIERSCTLDRSMTLPLGIETPTNRGPTSPSKPAKRFVPQPLSLHMDDSPTLPSLGDTFNLPTTRSHATLGSSQNEELACLSNAVKRQVTITPMQR